MLPSYIRAEKFCHIMIEHRMKAWEVNKSEQRQTRTKVGDAKPRVYRAINESLARIAGLLRGLEFSILFSSE
jgi:hypothetical protein